MSAYVEHQFKKGFILNEENVRKIHEIIVTRFKDIDDSLKPTYEIIRKDSFSYSTFDVLDIINEDNNNYDGIQDIIIHGQKDDEFYFNLSFSKKDNTKIEIKGENRDFVFLLLSDLRTYLNNEVNTVKLFKYSDFKSLFLILIMLALMIFLILTYNTFDKNPSDRRSYETAINTSDLRDKLDYLINDKYHTEDISGVKYIPIFMVVITIIGIIPIFFENLISKIIRFFYPTNLFLFGKAIAEHEKAKLIKNKILWTIIVGLIISIISGFIVYYVTSL